MKESVEKENKGRLFHSLIRKKKSHTNYPSQRKFTKKRESQDEGVYCL